MREAIRRTFGSLETRNFRLYFAGELISYIGSWMQTMAEAWLVLELTDSGLAVGATFAFRFLPVAIFGLWGGAVADHFNRRKVLIVTQSASAALAVVLALVVWTDIVEVWMVFALAVALGLVTVIDEPARHAFVEEMVGHERVANAVALNSAVANSARITGPAIAGVLIATVGLSWVFFVNAVSFFAVVAALLAMRPSELKGFVRPAERPRVREGLRYTWSLGEIRPTIVMVAVVGTLVYNFPTFLTLLADETFDGGAGLAGFFMGVLGVGTVIGGLVAAHRGHSSLRTVEIAGVMLGSALLVLALLPTQLLMVVALVPVGAMAVFFGTSANAHMQLSSAQYMRGRVMAVYMLLTLGSTVVGGPFVGWFCQHFSPRAGLALAGTATALTALAMATPVLGHTLRTHRTDRPVAPAIVD